MMTHKYINDQHLNQASTAQNCLRKYQEDKLSHAVQQSLTD